MKSKSKFKTNDDEQDNSEEIESLQDEIEKLENENKKLHQFIEENVLHYWSWDKVRKEFGSIENVQDAQAFLLRVLRDKAVCGNKDCPAFASLHDIDNLIFELRKNHGSYFDLKTAQIAFKNKQDKLISFEEDYWKIQYALMDAFNEIVSIGIPNETKQKNFYEIRQFLHEKHIDLLDHCDEAHIDINPSEEIDQSLDADNQMVHSEDFDDYGPDIFKERRKEIEANRKKREEEEKKKKKALIKKEETKNKGEKKDDRKRKQN